MISTGLRYVFKVEYHKKSFQHLATFFLSIYCTMNPDMNRNGNFALVLGWRGNTTHIHDFCIPLDLLGVKKNEKKGKKISNATAPFIEIL